MSCAASSPSARCRESRSSRPETLPGSLATVRDSLDTLLDFSFFITRKMRVQLQDSRISGTLPLLYIFLARSGCHIREVSFTGLDANGQFTSGRTLAPAVKIVFTGPGGKDQTLYYFSTDLSDGPVDKSGILKWCASLGPASGLLKAASYLMHTGGFDSTRRFLLTIARRSSRMIPAFRCGTSCRGTGISGSSATTGARSIRSNNSRRRNSIN